MIFTKDKIRIEIVKNRVILNETGLRNAIEQELKSNEDRLYFIAHVNGVSTCVNLEKKNNKYAITTLNDGFEKVNSSLKVIVEALSKVITSGKEEAS